MTNSVDRHEIAPVSSRPEPVHNDLGARIDCPRCVLHQGASVERDHGEIGEALVPNTHGPLLVESGIADSTFGIPDPADCLPYYADLRDRTSAGFRISVEH